MAPHTQINMAGIKKWGTVPRSEEAPTMTKEEVRTALRRIDDKFKELQRETRGEARSPLGAYAQLHAEMGEVFRQPAYKEICRERELKIAHN